MTAIAVDRRGLSLLQTQKWRKMQHDKHKNDLTVLRLILAPLLLFNSSHEQNTGNAVIAMVPGHGWSQKSLKWYRKRSPFLVKLTWEKTNQKGAGRYLPTGNHSGCDAVTSQSAAMFYDKLFSSLDFTLPKATTGRRGFPQKAMVCAFIIMKCAQ